MPRLRQAANVSKSTHLFINAGQAFLHRTLREQTDAQLEQEVRTAAFQHAADETPPNAHVT